MEPSLKRLSLERFEICTVRRSRINPAKYNPRLIQDGARKRLKQSIKQRGAVTPLVWNRRTGNLVSGHQRLSIYDESMKYNAATNANDYELTVAVIDVDEREEMTLNVQLNNDAMMGEWDLGLLANMNVEFGLDFGDLGFAQTDVDLLFSGDPRFSEVFADPPSVVRTKEEILEMRAQRADRMARAKEAKGKANSSEYYFVVVCEDPKDREILLRRLGVSIYEEYVGSPIVSRALSDEARSRASEPHPPTEDSGV